MKKLTLLLLLLVSTNVFAEWTRVIGSADGDMTTYVDFGTRKKKGNKVRMWSLNDFKTVQQHDNYKLLTIVEHNEINCEEETIRMLDVYGYSGNMKRGEIVYSDNNIKDETISIVPETTNEILLWMACRKK